MIWRRYVESLTGILDSLVVTDTQGKKLETDLGLRQAVDRLVELRMGFRLLYCIGNGASATIAAHFASDLGKNARVHTQVLTDAALTTAVANDIAYDQVFAQPLSWWMRPGDMLLCISSSGNSANILDAAKTARAMGCLVVTLSAMCPDNALRRLGDLNFYIAASSYGMAESGHAAIAHLLIDLVIA